MTATFTAEVPTYSVTIQKRGQPYTLVVAVPDSTIANTYVTVAEADAYFLSRRSSGQWRLLSGDAKAVVLLQAIEWMEQFTFKGYRRGYDQRLQFPRSYLYDRDGYWVDSETVPRFIKVAQMELAFYLIENDAFENTGLEEINTAAVGDLDVDVRQERKAGSLPRVVERILTPYRVGGGVGLRLIRA